MAGLNFLNYISHFFLISLAITFILIVFLIYHYKERIFSVEKKVETMFGLVSSMVKEMENIKGVVNTMFSSPPMPSFMPKPLNVMPTIHEELSLRNSFHDDGEDNHDNKEEDDDDDEEDDEDDDDDEDDEEDDDEEDKDDEDMPPLEKIEINRLSPEEEKMIDSIETFDIDDEPSKLILDEKSISFTHDFDEPEEQMLQIEQIEQIKEKKEEKKDDEKKDEEKKDDEKEEEEKKDDEKKEEQEQTAPTPSASAPTTQPQLFSKLSISELKKLVNQIQPSLDVSKMKKHDLIKFLEK